MRLSLYIGLLLALALAAAGSATAADTRSARPSARTIPSADSYSYARATRATGVMTFCGTSPRHWRNIVGADHPEWTRGLFMGSKETTGGVITESVSALFLAPDVCRDLIHWRSADRLNLRDALWTLGHEWIHAEQFAADRPLDEREAERLGAKRIPYLRVALGIRRRL